MFNIIHTMYEQQTSTHEPVKMEKAITAKQTDGGLSNEVAATPDLDKQRTGKTNTAETKTQPKTVTPPEGAGGNKPEDNSEKQVRFGDAAESTHRGRTTEETGAVLEFKTYRSPPRKRDEEVPSLCSTSSEQAPDSKGVSTNIPTKSISVDPSKDTTSPLASHEAEKNDKGAAGTEFEVSVASWHLHPCHQTCSSILYTYIDTHCPFTFIFHSSPNIAQISQAASTKWLGVRQLSAESGELFLVVQPAYSTAGKSCHGGFLGREKDCRQGRL